MAPTLIYFPIAGRAELIRLIAKVGGLDELEEVNVDFGSGLGVKRNLPLGLTAEEFGSPGGLPLLLHDDLKMNESGAIEMYVSLIAPKYKNLTPQQRAKDFQFCQLKESYIMAFGMPLFVGMTPEERASGFGSQKETFMPLYEKHFSVLEGILPETGFVNGLDYPTPADLAIVNICEGYMPFGSTYKLAGLDMATSFPKLHAHNERVKAVPAVARALEESKHLKKALPTF